ncbi:MAG TPA: hypothetical protein VFJ58_27240 [Armatimonadota bacterium]|nr:hypothetical protein [Armatimonadota bacterium]
MSSAAKSLNHRKQKAIDALLSHPSVEAAARASGLSHATLWRYLADPSFQKALDSRRSSSFAAVLERLQSSAASAIDVLERHLHADDPALQLRAALILLRQSEKATFHLALSRRLDLAETAIQDLEYQS